MQPTRRSSDLPRDLGATDPTRRGLTPREQEIALLISAGLKVVVIARRLGLSVSTVRTHVRSMQFRLGLTSRAALVAWVAERYTPDHSEAGLHRPAHRRADASIPGTRVTDRS